MKKYELFKITRNLVKQVVRKNTSKKTQKIIRYCIRRKTREEVLFKFLSKNAICAEIGAWKGDFSESILKLLNPQKLHLIDPWKYQTSFGKSGCQNTH